MTVQVAVFRIQPGLVGEGSLGFVVYGRDFIPHDFQKGFRDFLSCLVHAHGVELHDSYSRIIVDDKTRKVVSLAVNQAVDVVVRVRDQTDGNPCLVSLADTFHPKRIINFFFLETEHAHGNTADLVMPDSQVFVVVIIYFHDITFLNVVIFFRDGSREYPRVESVQRSFFTGF